jgi:glycine cleavage system aminomethyltransferase T
VKADYVAGGSPGQGQAVKLTGADDSGYFWFFSAANMEIVAKIASFCSGSTGEHGFYVSGLTDVAVTVTVTDMQTGSTWQKINPAGNNFCKDAHGGYPCP